MQDVSFAMQAQQEVDEVLGERQQPNMQDYAKLKYVMRCVNESMRLYPHPPVLLRRAMVQDELPGTVLALCLCIALALQPTLHACTQYQSILVSPTVSKSYQNSPVFSLLDTSPAPRQHLYSSLFCFVRFLQTDVILPGPPAAWGSVHLLLTHGANC